MQKIIFAFAQRDTLLRMLTLQINGQPRELDLSNPATLADVLEALSIKADRVAVEHNGAIVSRSAWSQTEVASGGRLEIVHFVGGGSGQGKLPNRRHRVTG